MIPEDQLIGLEKQQQRMRSMNERAMGIKIEEKLTCIYCGFSTDSLRLMYKHYEHRVIEGQCKKKVDLTTFGFKKPM